MPRKKSVDDIQLADAIALADELDKASDAFQQEPGREEHAAKLRLSSQMLRRLHDALVHVECQHMISTKVTHDMNEKGIDVRTPGTYCMTCGELIKVEKPPKEKKQ